MNDKQAWICVDAVAALGTQLHPIKVGFSHGLQAAVCWSCWCWSLRAEGCLYGAHVHLISLHNSMCTVFGRFQPRSLVATGRSHAQEFIDIVETIYRGARKGRGLVMSPKDWTVLWDEAH